MISSLIFGALLALAPPNGVTSVVSQKEPLNPAKRSPKIFEPNKSSLEFQWLVEGRAQIGSADLEQQLRFRVFSQERKIHQSLAEPVTKLLLKLWTLCTSRMKIDHKNEFGSGNIDVYLCWAGDPGGEQLFDQDKQVAFGLPSKVNTIYIYDLPSFLVGVEQVREIAHEYGHAVLPATGGYREPEYWGNGYLGEKLFMTWLAEEAKQGKVDGSEMLSVSAGSLSKWVNSECVPLMITAAAREPIPADFVPAGKSSMDNAIGLYLWMNNILPPSLLGRLLKICSNMDAGDIPKAMVAALDGCNSFSFNAPIGSKNKPLWIPTGAGTIKGAKLMLRKNGWSKVIPTGGAMTYLPK